MHVRIWHHDHILTFLVIPIQVRKFKVNSSSIQILKCKPIITNSCPKLNLFWKILLPIHGLYLIFPHQDIIILLPFVLIVRLSIISLPIYLSLDDRPQNHPGAFHILVEFIRKIEVPGLMHHFSREPFLLKWFELFQPEVTRFLLGDVVFGRLEGRCRV